MTMMYPPRGPHAVTGRWTASLLVVAAILAPHARAASDWPQWRFDSNRSAATEHAGPADPSLLWRLSLDYPDPSYDHQCRMCADITYAPIAAEGLLFIPSNVSDHGKAYDLGFPPQGYLAVIDGKLAVPSGRSLAGD